MHVVNYILIMEGFLQTLSLIVLLLEASVI